MGLQLSNNLGEALPDTRIKLNETRTNGIFGKRIEGFFRKVFMSERGYVRKRLCPEGFMSGRGYVRNGVCSGPWIFHGAFLIFTKNTQFTEFYMDVFATHYKLININS